MTDQTYNAQGTNLPGGNAVIQVLDARVQFDGSVGSGDSVPGPAHLLAASLAACILKNVERFSDMLSFTYTMATVDTALKRQSRPPRVTHATYNLDVHSNMELRKARLLAQNIRRYGTISNTLALSCEVNGRVWLVRPDGKRELALLPEL